MTCNKKMTKRVLLVIVLMTMMLSLTGCEGFSLPDISLPIDTGSEVANTVINVIWHILVYGVLAVVAIVVGVWLIVHAAIAAAIGLGVWLVTLIVKFIIGLF